MGELDPITRAKQIRSTDPGALYHVDPYKNETDVYLRLTNPPELLEEPAPVPGILDDRTIGHLIEPATLGAASIKYDLKLTLNVKNVVHRLHEWAGGTPDGLVIEDGAIVGGVEAKNVGRFSRVHLDDSIDSVPLHWGLQCNWFLVVTGAPYWILAVCDRGLFRFYVYYRDPAFLDRLLNFMGEWWELRIVKGVPPPLTSTELSRRWVQRTYPYHERPDMRFATDEELALLDEYLRLRMDLDKGEERRDDLEINLQAAIGEREGIRWTEGQVTWRRTKDRIITDWESMSRGLMNQFMNPEERQALIDFYTRTKAGSRRFLLTSRKLKERKSEEAA